MLVLHANKGDNMYLITDDCDYDSGIRYNDLSDARNARNAILAEIGTHMGDWIHVVNEDTQEIVREPGAWKTVDPDSGEVAFHHRDDEDSVDKMWDRGYLDVRPEWIPTYEWSN